MKRIACFLITLLVVTTGINSYASDKLDNSNYYGPVKEEEGLWSIASHLKSNYPNVSTQQLMIAIQKNNENAFEHDNINGLQSGSLLKLPNETFIIKNVSNKDSLTSVKSQNVQWKIVSTQLHSAIKNNINSQKINRHQAGLIIALGSTNHPKSLNLPKLIKKRHK